MAVSLDGMSPKELEALVAEVNSRMASVKSEQIRTMRSRIENQLAAEGLTVDEVFSNRARKVGKRAGAGMPKFRHPENAQQTWTGFGKKPRWFVEAIAKPGVTADSLMINKGAAGASKGPAKAGNKTAGNAAGKKTASKTTASKKSATRKSAK